MANKMLIDATHREETRVVVCKGTRVEEFDLESEHRRQLRGNIYLAKVTRVEPSLQAAFVDYGGNRHGFLGFAEIHPDYYQIPYSDRQELLKEAAEAEAAAAEREEVQPEADAAGERDTHPPDAVEAEAADAAAPGDDADGEDGPAGEAEAQAGAGAEAGEAEADGEVEAGEGEEAPARAGRGRRRRRRAVAEKVADPALREDADESGGGNGEDIASVGAEDALEEVPDRHVSRRRQYKIQEVIRRRQILLIQVVKEERGTKGAALTTYMSLAGRYCVLMPNTARGGGISRKITSLTDRRRLKSIAGDLKVPDGTGVIVRTAGANRTRAEIKRDFEYLQRLWESIRSLTLQSTAPSLIYAEGNLIKRSIRDLYNKEIEEVLVEGEEGYQEAKAFMRMLMPSHARHVKQYKDAQPLFVRHRVESQLDQMFSPVVTLKSGGYLVINQTEALVAVDVNSGKSTREHNIEDTALQTNLEAASEVARQLRLRDLAGLIVIDFIDMEERRNNRAVERRIKDCLKTDRARIQVGRISHFGLLEMSRQRIRASVIEGTMEVCRHCEGSGRVRSVSSTALQIVRSLEEMVAGEKRHNLTVSCASDIALYMLNRKRAHIGEIEKRYGIEITMAVDEGLRGSKYTIARGEMVDRPLPESADAPVQIDTAFDDAEPAEPPEPAASAGNDSPAREAEGEADQPARRRRRRRGRKRGDETPVAAAAEAPEADEPWIAAGAEVAAEEKEEGAVERAEGDGGGDGELDAAAARPKRRRGRRGGRRQRRDEAVPASAPASGEAMVEPAGDDAEPDQAIAGASAQASPAAPEPVIDDSAAPEGGGNGSAGGEPQPAIAWPWRRAAPAGGGTGDRDGPAEAGNGAHADSASADGVGLEDAHETAGEGAPAAAGEPPRGDEEAPGDSVAGGGEPAPSSAPQRRGWWQRRVAEPR